MKPKNNGRRPIAPQLTETTPPPAEPGTLADLIAQKEREIQEVETRGRQSVKQLWQQHDEARQAAAHFKQQATTAQGEINGILSEKQVVLQQLKALAARMDQQVSVSTEPVAPAPAPVSELTSEPVSAPESISAP